MSLDTLLNVSLPFSNQKPRTAIEKDLKGRWGGGLPGERFRCHLCGYKFGLGDYWRWVYSGGIHLTNLIVCEKCDGDDVLDRWKKFNEELERKYWWIK